MRSDTTYYPLISLYLNPLDRCNLKCRHCWLSPDLVTAGRDSLESIPRMDSGLTLGVMKRVLSEAKPLGLQSVKLTGGEPFLRKDILDLIGLFHDEGILVDIETNGTLIDRSVARELRGRVRTISVSLDAANQEVHDYLRGIKGAFGYALRGIRLVREQGINTQVIMSLSRKNQQQIEEMAYLASDLGVQSLKINPILPIGRGLDMHRRAENLTVQEILEIMHWVRDQLQARVGVPITFCVPVAFLSLQEIMEGNHSECAVLNILGIVENGDISFCGIQRVEKDLVMGNIYRDNLRDIWNHHPILQFMRRAIPRELKGVCGMCLFKKWCKGNCIACTYHLKESFLEPYWFCEQAYRNGHFPTTRLLC